MNAATQRPSPSSSTMMCSPACAPRPKQLPCRLLYDARRRGAVRADHRPSTTTTRRAPSSRCSRRTCPRSRRDVGPHARVIEPGSGAGMQDADAPAARARSARDVRRRSTSPRISSPRPRERAARASIRDLEVHADARRLHARRSRCRRRAARSARTLVFFPGSTIGNFEPDAARRFLAGLAALAGPTRDARCSAPTATRDREELLRAYDDSDGVTAAFDLNVLAHVNRTHGATFDSRPVHAPRGVERGALARSRCTWSAGARRPSTVGGAAIALRARRADRHRALLQALAARDCAACSMAAGWKVAAGVHGTEQPMRLWLCEPRRIRARRAVESRPWPRQTRRSSKRPPSSTKRSRCTRGSASCSSRRR